MQKQNQCQDTTDDKDFAVAQIEATCKTVEVLEQKLGRGRPRKNTSQTDHVGKKTVQTDFDRH